MKKVILASVAAAVIAGCSNTGGHDVDSVRDEVLSENFVAENIKVTSKGCNRLGEGRKCRIVSIDSTSTSPSFGGTDNNRQTALRTACAAAKANALTYVQGERVNTSQTVERIAVSSEIGESAEVHSSSEQQANLSSNRENSNNVTLRVTNTIRLNASGFMEGWYISDQSVVGPQEVSCTVTWSQEGQNLLQQFKSQTR